MSTGAHHFAMAEEYLGFAETAHGEDRDYFVKVADIHSTLANTAALLESARPSYPTEEPR